MRSISLFVAFTALAFLVLLGCDGSKFVSKSKQGDSSLRELLGNKEPMLAPIACLRDNNGNAIKAILTNDQAPSYAAQSGNDQLSSHRLMEKLFVFERGEDRLHLGSNPRLKGTEWVASSDVLQTSHFQVAKFSSDRITRELVKGFDSFESIHAFTQGQKVEASFLESGIGIGSDGNKNWMPILNTREITHGDTKIHVLELAAWTFDTSSLVAVSKHSRPQLTSSQLHNAMKRFSLVLVVDCTSSMSTVWKALNQKLKEIVQALVGEDEFGESEFDVSVAIVAYRDEDIESLWKTNKSAFTSDVKKLHSWLSRMQAVGGGDWNEALFSGLLEAVDLLTTDEQRSAYKSILLVADNAGHVNGTDPIVGDVGRDVIAKCKANGISISSLKVPYHSKFDGDKTTLPKQMQTLTNETNGASFELEAKDLNEQDTTIAIRRALLRSKEDAKTEMSIATQLKEGVSVSSLQNSMGLPEAALRWRIDNIRRRTEGRIQLNQGTLGVERVWIISDPRALLFGVMIPNEELEMLLRVLNRLVMDGPEKPASLMELWTELASQSLGEDIQLSEALRANGLPIRDNLLAITPSELVVMPRAQRRQYAAAVEAKYSELAKYRDSTQPDNGVWIIPLSLLP